jgi:CHAT domain
LLEDLHDEEPQRAVDELRDLLAALAEPASVWPGGTRVGEDMAGRVATTIEVAIGPSAANSGSFRVEVMASPAGEASVEVALDVEALLARRSQLQQAVLASAVSSRRLLPETERPLREVGQMLFTGLLGTGEVAGCYRAAAAVAAERGQGLRVVLRIGSPALATLPWEAMYDDATGAYVCRQDQLVRHVRVASVPMPLQVRPPLRILGVVSAPRGLPSLDVEKEQDQLARALARLVDQGVAYVHWAPKATWADLHDLLFEGEWHAVHFIGHGNYDSEQDEGYLALVGSDGRADLVAGQRLVDLLRQARPMPRLVVLNSCSSAAAGVTDLFSGTAATLVRGGVSAVAAMQYEISDPAAVAFARGFYTAIAHGRGVDDAVSSGRVSILGISNRTLEWVTPVLYLRGDDSRLFAWHDLATANASGRPQSSPLAMPGGLGSTQASTPQARTGAISGDGIFVVGLDIRQGVYRTAGPARGSTGYYALLSSTNTSDVINNSNFAGPATITVGPDVKAVEVSRCEPWHWLGADLNAVLRERQGVDMSAPSIIGGDGIFVVGLDIRQGVYRTAGPARGSTGYYALLSSTNTSDVINNSNFAGPATITVGPDVKAVEVSRCEPWHWLGPDLSTALRERR